MTVLLAVYNSEGCVGRCDARCYNATEHVCECICKGANHGVGKAQAIAQTTDAFEKWLDDYREVHDFSDVTMPGLYTTQTRSAITIARHINATCESGAYGNVVRDVRWVLDPQKGWGWEVDEMPKDADGVEHPMTTFYKSLKDVREGHGQMKMFPGLTFDRVTRNPYDATSQLEGYGEPAADRRQQDALEALQQHLVSMSHFETQPEDINELAIWQDRS